MKSAHSLDRVMNLPNPNAHREVQDLRDPNYSNLPGQRVCGPLYSISSNFPMPAARTWHSR